MDQGRGKQPCLTVSGFGTHLSILRFNGPARHRTSGELWQQSRRKGEYIIKDQDSVGTQQASLGRQGPVDIWRFETAPLVSLDTLAQRPI